jgi:hypothetical protein
MGIRRDCIWFGLAVAVALGMSVPSVAQDPDPVAAMREAMQPKACRTCHASEKEQPKLVDPYRCCDNNCERCHKDMSKHHPVAAEVKDKESVPLPLLGGDKVGCISCHDLKAPATDSKSWKSESLFARLFQRQSTYKTYYLRINNSTGKLCKTCH